MIALFLTMLSLASVPTEAPYILTGLEDEDTLIEACVEYADSADIRGIFLEVGDGAIGTLDCRPYTSDVNATLLMRSAMRDSSIRN